MDLLPITESIGDLVARYPQHANLFWVKFISQAGCVSIYSVKCDEDHDDGWNVDQVVTHLQTSGNFSLIESRVRANAVVDAHNDSVVAALSAHQNEGENDCG